MREIILEIISILVSSGIISFVFWVYTPESTVSAKVFLPIVIFCSVFLYGCIKYSFHLQNKLKKQTLLILPKLKAIQRQKLIFEPSELFHMNTVVSLFYKDIGEFFIGYGVVETILTDTKSLQVSVKEYISDDWTNEKVFEKKNNIVLKPSFPLEYLVSPQRQGEL